MVGGEAASREGEGRRREPFGQSSGARSDGADGPGDPALGQSPTRARRGAAKEKERASQRGSEPEAVPEKGKRLAKGTKLSAPRLPRSYAGSDGRTAGASLREEGPAERVCGFRGSRARRRGRPGCRRWGDWLSLRRPLPGALATGPCQLGPWDPPPTVPALPLGGRAGGIAEWPALGSGGPLPPPPGRRDWMLQGPAAAAAVAAPAAATPGSGSAGPGEGLQLPFRVPDRPLPSAVEPAVENRGVPVGPPVPAGVAAVPSGPGPLCACGAGPPGSHGKGRQLRLPGLRFRLLQGPRGGLGPSSRASGIESRERPVGERAPFE